MVLGALLVQLAILPAGAELRSSLGPLVALYTAGEQLERRLAIGILIGFGVALAALVLRQAGLPDGLQQVIQTEFLLLVAWLLGMGLNPTALRTGSRGARSPPRNAARGGEPPRGSGGAGTDRPGASRRGDPPRQRHRHSGRWRAARPSTCGRRRHASPRGDRCDRPPCADRHAADAWDPRRRRERGTTSQGSIAGRFDRAGSGYRPDVGLPLKEFGAGSTLAWSSRPTGSSRRVRPTR